jgi:hypothetical protein
MTGATLSYAGQVNQPADLLNLHPGASGENSTVRWTASATGSYQIQGRFQGLDITGTTTDVHVLRNNVEVWGGIVNGFNAQASFNLTIAVNAADVIEFVVGTGGNSYASDSTGLAAVINAAGGGGNPAPTPTPIVTPTPTPITTPAPTPTPVQPPPSGTAFNAVADFGPVNNPAGVWSYGYKANPAAPFTVFSSSGQPWSGISVWSPNAGGNCCAMVAKNMTGATQTYAGQVSQPADLLNLHPGAGGEIAVLRWTSPAAGSYQIEGRFQGLDMTGPTTDVHILRNGTEIWAGNVNGYNNQTVFNLTITINAGEVIEFVVGTGGNSYSNDSTGLAAVISPR